MKSILRKSIIMLIVLLFGLVGCAKPTPESEIMQEPTIVETVVVTETPEVEVTTIPTEEPIIPCNITFDSDRDGNREVYSMAADGSNQVNLTNSPADDFDPVWSPEGKFVAFVSNRENDTGGGQFIYTMLADGTEVGRISQENDSAFPDWSPTGEQIAYSSNGDIFLINVNDVTEVNLTNSPDRDEQPKISPDGQKIAWLKGDDNDRQLFVMDLDGGNIVQVSNGGKIHGAAWSVDGRILANWQDQPDGICSNCIITADGMEIKDAGGKGAIQEFLPFWTVDGDRVEMGSGDINGTGREDIFLVGENFPDLFYFLTDNSGNNRNPDSPFLCGPSKNANETDVESNTVTEIIDASEMVIGYEGDFNVLMQEDLDKACSELGVQCIRGESFSELASLGVDAIISGSNRWHIHGSYPDLHSAIEQGIPVFVLNAETSDQGAYNLSAEHEIYTSTLNWMLQEMGGQGEFVYYNLGDSGYIQEIVDAVLQEYPGITAISKEGNYDTVPVTEQVIADVISENPNIGAIWISEQSNDLFWVINNEQSSQPPLIECPSRKDMLINWKNSIDSGSSLKCITQIRPGGTAYEGVYVAYYFLSGLKFKPDAFFEGSNNTLKYDIPVITNETLPEWIGVKLESLQEGVNQGLYLPPMTPEEIKAKWFIE